MSYTYEYSCSIDFYRSYNGSEQIYDDSGLSSRDYPILESFLYDNGIKELGQYFVPSINITGFDIDESELFIYFESDHVLSKDELNKIKLDFDGQMSDGFGEGVEQISFSRKVFSSSDSEEKIIVERYIRMWWSGMNPNHKAWTSSCEISRVPGEDALYDVVKEYFNDFEDLHVEVKGERILMIDPVSGRVIEIDPNLWNVYTYKTHDLVQTGGYYHVPPIKPTYEVSEII